MLDSGFESNSTQSHLPTIYAALRISAGKFDEISCAVIVTPIKKAAHMKRNRQSQFAAGSPQDYKKSLAVSLALLLIIAQELYATKLTNSLIII